MSEEVRYPGLLGAADQARTALILARHAHAKNDNLDKTLARAISDLSGSIDRAMRKSEEWPSALLDAVAEAHGSGPAHERLRDGAEVSWPDCPAPVCVAALKVLGRPLWMRD